MIHFIQRMHCAVWRRFGGGWVHVLRYFYRIQIQDGMLLVGEPVIRNHGQITIGKTCLLVSLGSGNPLWCSRPCIFHAELGAKITIGDGFKASGCCLVAKQEITIGNNVLLGVGVTILDNDMHSLNHLTRGGIFESRGAPVTIEDNVWIGAGVTVLKGVRIGRNSVIGVGVTLRSDVPADSIVTPATHIRRASRVKL
mgnify:CR=1 FL=1